MKAEMPKSPPPTLHFEVPKSHPLAKGKIGQKAKVIVHGTIHSLSHYPDDDKTSVGMHGYTIHHVGGAASADGGNSQMTCPQCGASGAGPYCEDCGAKMKAVGK